MSYEGPHPLPVKSGATGKASNTAYGLIAGGTTATGAFQNISTGTATQNLVSAGAGALPAWTNTSLIGNRALLSSQTASSSASIVFTSVITATYNVYLLSFSNIIPANAGDSLQLAVSTNNGSSYIATNYLADIGTFPYNSATNSQTSSTTTFLLSGATQASTPGVNGQVKLMDVTNGSQFILTGFCNYMNTGGPFLGKVFGNNTATSVNALQVTFSTGNIASGTFSLYGLLE